MSSEQYLLVNVATGQLINRPYTSLVGLWIMRVSQCGSLRQLLITVSWLHGWGAGCYQELG